MPASARVGGMKQMFRVLNRDKTMVREGTLEPTKHGAHKGIRLMYMQKSFHHVQPPAMEAAMIARPTIIHWRRFFVMPHAVRHAPSVIAVANSTMWQSGNTKASAYMRVLSSSGEDPEHEVFGTTLLERLLNRVGIGAAPGERARGRVREPHLVEQVPAPCVHAGRLVQQLVKSLARRDGHGAHLGRGAEPGSLPVSCSQRA